MDNIREEYVGQLQRAHDRLKRCRFRETFNIEDVNEYITQLWELSDAWGCFCYRTKRDEQQQKLITQFCSWIHDYNSLLLRIRHHRDDIGYIRYWVPYFEAMLNITHCFLDTGNMDVFYNPYVYSENDKHKTNALGERWMLITSEMCGINSSELPRYFPVTLPLCTDLEKMKNWFFKTKYYGLKGASEEQRSQHYANWKENVLPVLIWINENIVSKSAKENGVASIPYYADPK